MKKTNWRVYVRDHIYPQSISAYLDLMFRKDVSRYPYFARFYEVMSFVGPDFWWARDLDQLEKRFRSWTKEWLSRPAVLRSYIRSFRSTLRHIRKVVPQLKKKMASARHLTDREVLNVFNQTKQLFWENIQYSEYGVDLFDDFFDKLLSEQFSKVRKTTINPHDWVMLMCPAYASVVMQYKLALNALSMHRTVTPRDITAVADRFYWIMMSWDGSNELTPEQVRRELRSAAKRPLAVRQRDIRTISGYAQSVIRARQKLFIKYRLPLKPLWQYFRLLDIFAELHDFRKESQMRNSQVIFLTLREMARRFRVPFGDLVYYFNDEIERLCITVYKVSHQQIKARKQGITLVVNNNRTSKYIGRGAYSVVKRLVLDSLRSSRMAEISGLPACTGVVRGQTLIAKSAKEANQRIQKGMVLVASMTTVDYVPAMHKAAAIVTDDGGLACHAAIVSRELGVPCIVGTKIATQAFKTGDKVEVDAAHGIVKRL
jgi:phosphohistidine swiveling domain-containing protein